MGRLAHEDKILFEGKTAFQADNPYLKGKVSAILGFSVRLIRLLFMTLSTFCRSIHAFCRALLVTGLTSLMKNISCRRSIIFCPRHLMTRSASSSFLRICILVVTNDAINFCLLGVCDVREYYRRHLSFQLERHRIRHLFLRRSGPCRKRKSTNKD